MRHQLTTIFNRLQPWLKQIQPWIDPFTILAWGILLLKYWVTGKLNILIHPNYFALTVVGGIGLVGIGGVKLWDQLQASGIFEYSKQSSQKTVKKNIRPTPQNVEHISFFPPGWSSAILLVTAILGLLITPRTFGSQTALQRGLTESLPVTRTQPQAFQTAAKPEDRTLIEWVRMLNVNPEPDTYTGQKVKVTGFIIYPPSLPEGYLWLSRFVITCCAADAYPIGLPVLPPPETNLRRYPQDSWLEVEGEMMTQTFNGERRLTIQAKKFTPIPEPRNPYDY